MLWAWLGALAVSAAAAAASFPDPGSSWPTKEETAVIGLVGAKGFVEYGSAPFLLFSNISNSEVSTLDSAKSNGGVWTCQRSQKKLSALSSAVQLKWAGKVKVIVKRAWMAPLQGSSGNCDAQEAKIPSQPTLYNEGRAVGTCIAQNSCAIGEIHIGINTATCFPNMLFNIIIIFDIYYCSQMCSLNKTARSL